MISGRDFSVLAAPMMPRAVVIARGHSWGSMGYLHVTTSPLQVVLSPFLSTNPPFCANFMVSGRDFSVLAAPTMPRAVVIARGQSWESMGYLHVTTSPLQVILSPFLCTNPPFFADFGHVDVGLVRYIRDERRV